MIGSAALRDGIRGIPDPVPEVRIHYLRPPTRTTVYRQHLVHDDGRVKITLARNVDLDAPLVIEGEVALERGSDAVWFTYPGTWHDIARFHRADGIFTGIYVNIITPCIFHAREDWSTTDLFLDLWIPASTTASAPLLLDAEELDGAEAAGHLPPHLAQAARREAERLLREPRRVWPPEEVALWTRERAVDAVSRR